MVEVTELEKQVDGAGAEEARLMDLYESAPGEVIGADREEWLRLSFQVTTLQRKVRVKLLMQKGAAKELAERYSKEAEGLTTQITPLLDEMEVLVQDMVEVLAGSEAIRMNVKNWGLFPMSLRKMLKRGLDGRGVDVRSIVHEADEEEARQEREQLERASKGKT